MVSDWQCVVGHRQGKRVIGYGDRLLEWSVRAFSRWETVGRNYALGGVFLSDLCVETAVNWTLGVYYVCKKDK